MIQNKKVQDLFPEGTKVTIKVTGDDGYYKGTVDFSDLVGISLTNFTYEIGGFNTGVNTGIKFLPYGQIVSIDKAGGAR
jgi:hypothetical protein